MEGDTICIGISDYCIAAYRYTAITVDINMHAPSTNRGNSGSMSCRNDCRWKESVGLIVHV
jgi:hypothetical protein